jgi:alpha-mannosidase
VKGALSVPAPGSATRCIAVGHAHLDTAWLWPVRETRRKCLRSFTNVLRLMERFPDFRFLCSQAQQYAFVEEDAPEVFDQIARRVREGRWEPGGAMWVEPDANCPSGESLVRQILHGTRYWEDRFGPAGRQRFLFLPDTFGFPASLPQIIAAAGLDTFITNKLAWNPVNRYPDTSFRWRGIDGAEVNAHLTPGADYNAVNTPRELRRGESRHASTHIPGVEGAARWLQPFGYGDGGGGPTDRSVAYAELAADCDGLPRVSLGRADQFCAALEADFQALRARGGSPPVWDGELYLDLHRGTLTTQAWLKRANRRAEELLALAEMVTVAAPGESLSECRHADGLVRAALDRAWKLVLLNQFHDILPGSSIAAVYEDARRDHEEVRALLEPIADAGLARWARTLGGPIVVNPTGADRRAVVEVGGRLHLIDRIPAHGARLLSEPEAPSRPVRVERGRVLDNGILRAEIGPGGGVNSLLHLPTGREAAAGQPLNRLALYQDHPRMWDAWDIDPEAETLPVSDVGAPDSVEVVREDPLRAEIRVLRRLGERSRVEQVYRLDAESPRLDVVTTVEWREDHRLLRALFPVAVRARDATYDIQFGSLTRPTHRNTPWDRARFEVCAHRWMDLSEPGFGVALLNDGKYGHSCLGSVMGLTLLRAPTWPDPDADRGEHRFTYALMPHAGDWRRAGVDAEAQALNTPPFHHHHATSQAGPAQTWSPFTLEARGPAALRVEALKPAEDGRGAILRLVEFHGGTGEVDLLWTDPPTRAEPADLLERPASSGPAACAVGHDPAAGRTRLSARPFGIITLRLS